jgi:hypothetical protein
MLGKSAAKDNCAYGLRWLDLSIRRALSTRSRVTRRALSGCPSRISMGHTKSIDRKVDSLDDGIIIVCPKT